MRTLLLFLAFASLAAEESTLEQATVAIYAVDMKTGQVLLDENSDKSLTPGSCMKIATTAAAFFLLGPEERFQTELEYDGALNDDGVLEGNLYIHGSGDPCLGSDRVAGSLSWQEQIQAWVEVIAQKGICEIKGRVIADDSRWESARAAPSWAWEDLGNYYGAGASALSFHENSYCLFFRSGENVGDATQVVRMDPPETCAILQNEVKTGPKGSGDRACIYGSECSPVQYVRGTIPLGSQEFCIRGAISDPAAFCAYLLTQGLEKGKIAVENKKLPQGKRTIFHTTISPPLEQIVFWTNQKSINLYAEHLLKAMGERVKGIGSTEAGREAIEGFLKGQGIDLRGWYQADGSGLSRKNLATAKQLVGILQLMKKSEHFPQFLRSLPEIRSGVHAKSGSMSQIRAYAGYSGDVAFAFIVDHCLNCKLIEARLDKMLENIHQEK